MKRCILVNLFPGFVRRGDGENHLDDFLIDLLLNVGRYDLFVDAHFAWEKIALINRRRGQLLNQYDVDETQTSPNSFSIIAKRNPWSPVSR